MYITQNLSKASHFSWCFCDWNIDPKHNRTLVSLEHSPFCGVFQTKKQNLSDLRVPSIPQAAGTYPSSSQHVFQKLCESQFVYFNMFHPPSSTSTKKPTRSTKEKHIFDLVTAVPVTTQPPPPPPSRPTQPGLQPAGPKLSRTRLSAEPLNGVVAILEYQNSLGKGWGGERDLLDDFGWFWYCLYSWERLGRRETLDDFWYSHIGCMGLVVLHLHLTIKINLL